MPKIPAKPLKSLTWPMVATALLLPALGLAAGLPTGSADAKALQTGGGSMGGGSMGGGSMGGGSMGGGSMGGGSMGGGSMGGGSMG
ncbi:MAG: hypothetical protein V4457_02180, partial [Pseudomonadota bacterium]